MKMNVVDTEYSERTSGSKNVGEPLIEGVELPDVYIRSMYFEKTGETNRPHKHPYAHYTLLAFGSCVAEIDGVKTTYTAPTTILTPAHVLHYFTALEPCTALHCINVLHDGVPVVE